MSRARTVQSLCRRAATALGQQRPPSLSLAAAGGRPVVTAAATGAAVGGTMMKVMGVDVPYAYVIGTALAVGFGAYTYEYLQVAKEQDRPLQATLMRHPDIRSLDMADQNGRQFTAGQLAGKWALIDFGSLSAPADVRSINAVCRSAEAAQQATGATIVPVYLSVDPATDKPADLKRVVAAAGHPGLVALTGGADGVLSGVKGDERYKHGDSALDDAYVSSFVYLVSPSGEFARLWPKDVPISLLSDAVARAVKE